MKDILSALEQDTSLKKSAYSHKHGRELVGPCPWCGGTDRFHVWPDANALPDIGALGRFLCMGEAQGRAGCGRSGNALRYLQQRHQMTFAQACEHLEIDMEQLRTARRVQKQASSVAVKNQPREAALAEQSEVWQRNAQALVQYGQEHLVDAARDYLSARGLSSESINAHQLGYYPTYKQVRGALWGYPKGILRIPRGLMIPWRNERGQILCLRFRRLPDDESQEARDAYGVDEKTGRIKRYRVLAGSSSALLYRGEQLTPGCVAVLVEGELDALLATHLLDDPSVVVIATGSTSWGRREEWIRRLAACAQVLVCYDADPAGDKAASYWLAELRNAVRWRPWWSDAGEMFHSRNGADLKAWLALGLEQTVLLPQEASPPNEHVEEEIPDELRCSQCPGLVEHYSDQGIPFCARCRDPYGARRVSASPSLNSVTSAPFFLIDLAHIAEAWKENSMNPSPNPKQFLALDLETTGLHPLRDRVVSIILGTPGNVSILDMRPYYCLSGEEQEAWRERLASLLTQPEIVWVGHNLKFDWQFLAAHFGVKLAHVYDTMIAEQLLYGVGLHDRGVSVSLQKTAARYDLTVTKEQRAWFPGLDTRPEEWASPFPTEQLTYMVQDVEIAYRLYILQQPKLHAQHLETVTDLENEALPALAAMELAGVRIDATRWREILARKQRRQEALGQKVREVLGQALCTAYTAYQEAERAEEKRLMQAYQMQAGKSTWEAFRKAGLMEWQTNHPPVPAPPKEGINLASSGQLQAALAASGIAVSSAREGELEGYAKQHTIIADLVEWRKLEKFRSAFGENILAMIDADGRLRTNYAQIGAVSGRIICSNPNLQQIPAKETNEEENLRSCFVAPPGSVILKADLSNIELRILAEVANDQTMLRLFAEGQDLHAETAKMMFGLPPDTDTKKHLYKAGVSARAVAKTINFGLAYGMGAQGLANRIGCSVEDAKELVKAYFATYAGIATWLRAAGQQAKKRGYAVTLAGRKRWFNFDADEYGSQERSAKNHPVQGTNADILKCALALLYKVLPEGASLIHAVHDELVIECREELVCEVEALMKEMMVRACRQFLKVVHIPSPEVIVASYWKKDD